MAVAVADAMDAGAPLVVEAGTGTGKTLAYLVPALVSGRRTIVSTATRGLQEQIVRKDAALLAELARNPITCVTLKGRTNYLCLHDWDRLSRRPPIELDGVPFARLAAFVESTETGDRAELPEVADAWAGWSQLARTGERCLGSSCPRFSDCFVYRARARAEQADLIVVNHHLFAASRAAEVAQGRPSILPEAEAWIFDEAHHLPTALLGAFARTVSDVRVQVLVRDIQQEAAEGLSPEDELVLLSQADAVLEATNRLWVRLRRVLSGEVRADLDALVQGDARIEIEQLVEDLDRLLRDLAAACQRHGTAAPVFRRVGERANELRSDLKHVFSQGDVENARIVERGERALFLVATPLDPRPIARNALQAEHTRVFTSATMSVGGDFRFLRQRVGLDDEARGLVVDSPFDYPSQAVFYIPAEEIEPNAPDFLRRRLPEVEALLGITDGRALLLFTSYRNMEETARRLRRMNRWRILVQGEGDRNALLEEFRRDERSVLLATAAFWEGIDVPGSSLSLVIIDRLPFGHPGDPLQRARERLYASRGQSFFTSALLPEAAIALRQGVGRLVRTRNDRGIVAVLDTRLVTRGYGRRLLGTLPPLARMRSLDDVARWWRSARPAHP